MTKKQIIEHLKTCGIGCGIKEYEKAKRLMGGVLGTANNAYCDWVLKILAAYCKV